MTDDDLPGYPRGSRDLLLNRAEEPRSGERFVDFQPVLVSSDDAYDEADKLDAPETILEDKRTGECYYARDRDRVGENGGEEA